MLFVPAAKTFPAFAPVPGQEPPATFPGRAAAGTSARPLGRKAAAAPARRPSAPAPRR